MHKKAGVEDIDFRDETMHGQFDFREFMKKVFGLTYQQADDITAESWGHSITPYKAGQILLWTARTGKVPLYIHHRYVEDSKLWKEKLPDEKT